MIEKKISYDINIEKPSKTKPVKQGGVLNYLGKQKTVSVPVKWRSSPKHPIAHLAYITKDEEKILVDLDLYGSLKGKPNKGPSGIMSLNGGGGGGDGGGGDGGGSSGGDSGDSGDSGDAGDSGPGGSDDGTGHGGPGVGGFDGGMSSSESAAGAGFGTDAMGEFGDTGISSMGQTDTFASDVDENVTDVDMSPPALQTIQEKATALAMSQLTPAAMAGRALGMMTGIPGMGIFGSIMGSNIGRGVVSPGNESFDQDYGQNVQTSTTSTSGQGGLTSIPMYAPLYNTSTGDNTIDALIAMYRKNLGLN